MARLSEVKGNILDDNSVIESLESLKKEAMIVADEVEKTKKVALELKQVSDLYESLAAKFSGLFFTLASMEKLNHYQQWKNAS